MNKKRMPADALEAEHRVSARESDETPAAQTISDAERRDRSIRQRHRLVLIGVAIVAAGAMLLQTVNDDRVAIRGLPDYPFPHTCASRMVFNAGCPGCGMTRSFIHLAAGRWEESLEMHRLGWLLALVMVLQIPYRAAGLLGKNPLPLGRRFPVVLGYSLVVVFFGNWFYSLLM